MLRALTSRFRTAMLCSCAVALLAGWAAVTAHEPLVGKASPTSPRTEASADVDRASVKGEMGSPERGFRWLTEKEYLPPDFDQATFDSVWRSWPEPLRSEAERASPDQRRRMAFARYGLTSRSEDQPDQPLQYVVDAEGQWTMNCFSCHGGSVYGEPYPGAPNNRYALQTLTEEIRRTKFKLAKPMSRMDLGSLVIPLGSTEGRTNAVMFGVGLMHFRDPDLNVVPNPEPPEFTHHDMDAPPWWHFHRKPMLYIDGFAPRGHRPLMQFMLVRENGPEKFREWEQDYRDVYAYLMSLRPPEYPGPVDEDLRERGRLVFNDHCARCHGTYGDGSPFPNITVPIDEIGTDPVRHQALTVAARELYASSWFARNGSSEASLARETVLVPEGYVAPPLDGVWASPPYFHNGSVPTLWHVLNPDQRPVLWRRTSEEIDHERIGFQIEEVERIPPEEEDIAVRRQYFDTRSFGHSAAGHDFPLELSISERRSVLEYLKTL